MKLRRVLIRTALCPSICAVVYFGVWRTASMMHEVGLSGWLPESGRDCHRSPTGHIRWCDFEVHDSLGPIRSDRIVLDRFRRPLEISHLWRSADSAAWARAQDSVQQRFREAQPLVCESEWMPPRSKEWQLDRQDVRLSAFHQTHWRPGDPVLAHGRHDVADDRAALSRMRARAVWLVRVRGEARNRGCEPHVHVRMLTPREIVAEVNRALAAIWNGAE